MNPDQSSDKIERLGVVQLGIKTDHKLLGSLLPVEFVEKVYDNGKYWSAYCKGFRLSDIEWQCLVGKIISGIGKQLKEIYAITSNGIEFVVYIKKY